jgi:hypothetical protein
MVRSMKEAKQSTRIRMRQKINELTTIQVSSTIEVSLLNSLAMEAKLIQVTSTVTKYTNKSFLSRLENFFLSSLFGLKDGFGLDG